MKQRWLWLAWLGSAALGSYGAVSGAQSGGSGSASSARARLRSPIVYPEAGGGIRMSHATPAHRRLGCDQCHLQSSAAAGWPERRAPEAVCVRCHADRTDRSQLAADTCGYCHAGYDPARAPAIAPPKRARPRLHFSHARHRQLTCERCHGGGTSIDAATADRGGAAAAPELPAMATCLSCHRGEQALACGACHLTEPSGRLRTSFPDGELIPQSGFLGIAHDADFSVRHRWLAADQAPACRSCHVEAECAECHDGARRPRAIHPNDYLTLHAQDARRAATRCNGCHSTQSFCLACHARLGVAQLSAPDLGSPRRFHPPAGMWTRGPVLHAREAQRSLATCITCHSERDCVACHASPAGTAGSPHPRGFANGCSGALSRNPRPCLMCHRAADPQLSRCR